jgi:hypothetical protein
MKVFDIHSGTPWLDYFFNRVYFMPRKSQIQYTRDGFVTGQTASINKESPLV